MDDKGEPLPHGYGVQALVELAVIHIGVDGARRLEPSAVWTEALLHDVVDVGVLLVPFGATPELEHFLVEDPKEACADV